MRVGMNKRVDKIALALKHKTDQRAAPAYDRVSVPTMQRRRAQRLLWNLNVN